LTQAVRWDIDVILTDVTKTWLELRAALAGEGVLPIGVDMLFNCAISGLRCYIVAVQPIVPLDELEVLCAS